MNRKNCLLSKLLPKKVFALAAGMAFILGVFAVTDAHAWWDGKWQQRKKIQFDASSKGADLKDNLTDIPVLVRLHTGNFGFSGAKADGSDIRFVSGDDKSPLKYHIEKFDPKEEIALIWVKVPRISAGSSQDFIWMYYGNSSATDGQDAGGTFDVSQVAAYHLSERDGSPRDSTAYGNHVALFKGKLGVPSLAGNGVQIADEGYGIKIAKSPSLNFSKGFTFSSWVRMNQSSGNTHLLSWDDGRQAIVIGIDNGNAYLSAGSGKGQTTATTKTAALTLKQWHHLAAVVGPYTQVTLYVDGNEAASGAFKGPVPAPDTDIVIGGSAKGANPFFGDLDEVELANAARSADWIRAAFQGQSSEGVLTSVLEEESGGGGGGESLTIHLMKVIIRTITLDGWLIIGLLVCMGFWALYIARQKTVLLNQAKKGNHGFSQSFRTIEHPLSLLNKDEDFEGSPLYRVYCAGCEELKLAVERRKESLDGSAKLSERTLNGFRASVEKAAMYESRRFSAGMFILTLCVAGGPFLGLLGTVWGVMNTFASLAESGEANLSAIAPGVASALACTLAGLLVAIPALFVSNYLTGRIKDQSADVNVFIDDFILMLEEGK